MLIYEVNLEVDEDINHKMAAFLQEHLQKMLDFKGFKSAYWYFRRPEDEEREPTHTLWTVQYVVDSQNDLDDYLNNHAQNMRSETDALFQGQYRATRRILHLLGVAGLKLPGGK